MPRDLHDAITISYDADAMKTYKAAFLAHIGMVHRWELFGVDLMHRSNKEALSWVPDISRKHSNGSSPAYQFSSGFYSACDTELSDGTPTQLTVTGVHCATVCTASSPVPMGQKLALQAVRSLAAAKSEHGDIRHWG